MKKLRPIAALHSLVSKAHIHPNTKGEKIMAERWFDAIESYLKNL